MRRPRSRFAGCVAASVALASAGCAGPDVATTSAGPRGPVMRNAAPAGSPLARVSPGMTKLEVRDAIGDPTDSHGHLTNKNLNPFYFGSERYLTTWSYAGQGRLTFDQDARLTLVESDPTETGRGE